ncbi:hypothetical protein C8R48DRAFT_670855 [Suillus tomentosus]|nr:hypothetical protein C8R48DRAFT_670855 [Suillus tomentosus]
MSLCLSDAFLPISGGNPVMSDLLSLENCSAPRRRAASAAVLDAKMDKIPRIRQVNVNGEPNALIQTNIVFFTRPATEQVSWDPPETVLVQFTSVRRDTGETLVLIGTIDDSHVLASLLKLWLRELWDILMPEEMYDD